MGFTLDTPTLPTQTHYANYFVFHDYFYSHLFFSAFNLSPTNMVPSWTQVDGSPYQNSDQNEVEGDIQSGTTRRPGKSFDPMKSPLKAGSLLANPDTAAFAGEINSVATKGTSIVMDFIPVIGTGKGFYEAYTGVDSITGAELAWWERGINLIPLAGPMLRKGVKAAGLLGDALKYGNKVDDVIDAASDAQRGFNRSANNLIDSAQQLSKKTPELPIKDPGCFPAGTLVSTEVGLKPIEEIQEGSQVWA